MLKVANSVINASRITGTLPVANGGTGVTTSTGTGNTVLSAAPTLSGDVGLSTGNLIPSTAAKGINFTANTPAAGMTSQLLNWYEEGTFTPTITGFSSPGVGTYTTQLGCYTRVGNVVNFSITITQTAHTGTGVMIVNGLPFTIGGPSGSIYAASARSSNLTLTALNVLQVALAVGSTNFAFEQVPVGGGSAANVSMDAAFDLAITGSYFI